MNSAVLPTPEEEARGAEFLADASSLFNPAVTIKETSESDREALPARFQSLLERYMNDEHRNAISMFQTIRAEKFVYPNKMQFPRKFSSALRYEGENTTKPEEFVGNRIISYIYIYIGNNYIRGNNNNIYIYIYIYN